jgi:hypothetical protein
LSNDEYKIHLFREKNAIMIGIVDGNEITGRVGWARSKYPGMQDMLDKFFKGKDIDMLLARDNMRELCQALGFTMVMEIEPGNAESLWPTLRFHIMEGEW